MPEEVEKNFTTATRTMAKLVKVFKDLPGCLNIAKQVSRGLKGLSLPLTSA